jgi:ankyrin repeat protein
MKRSLIVTVTAAWLAWIGSVHAQWIIPFDARFIKASQEDDVNKVKSFLDKQPDINAPGKEATTFLQAAAYWGRTNAVQLLIEKGAKLDLRDQNGQTALHYAAIFNYCEMLSDSPPELQKLQAGKKNACQLLLQAGAAVDAKAHEGNTPLHWAVTLRHWHPAPTVVQDICALLIAKGAEVNATNSLGETPLHLAAKYSLTNVCAFLIAKGVDVNRRDRDGQTPLHRAMDSQWADPDRVAMKTTADILIQAGAEINATDQDGNTALHWAVARRCTELCAFLLSKGANPAIKNNKNETALDWATKASDGNRDRIIELLGRPPAPNR